MDSPGLDFAVGGIVVAILALLTHVGHRRLQAENWRARAKRIDEGVGHLRRKRNREALEVLDPIVEALAKDWRATPAQRALAHFYRAVALTQLELWARAEPDADAICAHATVSLKGISPTTRAMIAAGIYVRVDEIDRAREIYSQVAEADARDAIERQNKIAALSALAQIANYRGDDEEASALLDRAEALLEAGGAPASTQGGSPYRDGKIERTKDDTALVLIVQRWALVAQRQAPAAVERIARSRLDAALRLDDPSAVVNARSSLALALIASDRPDEAVLEATRANEAAAALEPTVKLRTAFVLGHARERAGDLAGGIRVLETALEAKATPEIDASILAVGRSFLASAYFSAERFDEAIALRERARVEHDARVSARGVDVRRLPDVDRAISVGGLTSLALARADAGELDAAREDIDAAVAESASIAAGRYEWTKAAALAIRGEILRRSGETERARADLVPALARLTELIGEHHSELAIMRLYFARLLADEGRRDEARAELDRARADIGRVYSGQAHPWFARELRVTRAIVDGA